MRLPFPRCHVTVVGIGHLGLTHAVCLAEVGHDVIGVDTDASTVAKAARGEVPFFEPGLEPMLRKNLDTGRLRFTTSYAEAAQLGDVHFLCVGTPQSADGSADLRYIESAVGALAPGLTRRCLVVGKSTVPVGTARRIAARVQNLAPAASDVDVAWNPEFLREGRAVQDSLSPDRIVFGVASSWSAERLRDVYAVPLANGVPVLVMDLETAELVKVAANSFLATKISFINAMAEACEATGADVTQLAAALAHDERIGGKFLSPGVGFGGGCLPKDIRAFRVAARDLGVTSVANLLAEVDAINMSRRARVIDLAREAVGGSLDRKRVAVLGVAFKPGSDDVRDSPSLDVCDRLSSEGAAVSVHDPVAIKNAVRVKPHLRYAETVTQAATGADLVMHLTDWADYRAIDPVALGRVVASRSIVDARCALDVAYWRSAGWLVRVLGRP